MKELKGYLLEKMSDNERMVAEIAFSEGLQARFYEEMSETTSSDSQSDDIF